MALLDFLVHTRQAFGGEKNVPLSNAVTRFEHPYFIVHRSLFLCVKGGTEEAYQSQCKQRTHICFVTRTWS